MIDNSARIHFTVGDLLLRLIGAALQIFATWAIVHALTAEAAGVYFRGFVISFGLATLLRAKYELYLSHHLVGRHGTGVDVMDGVLLMQLARRMLMRVTVVCAILLVISADLDIQAPRLEPALETYLPFVLAIPCVSLYTLIGEALRAANHTLLGTIVAAYAMNLAIILAVVLIPSGTSVTMYAWAYFGGSLIAAAAAVGLAWKAFPMDRKLAARPIARETLDAVDDREFIGLARGLLVWGPISILAVWAPAIHMAEYAVAARTALIVDFFLPNKLGSTPYALMRDRSAQSPRTLLLSQLVAALIYSSIFIAALLAAGPATLALFGEPYAAQFTIYALLLGTQWANSVGRPAVLDALLSWDARRIRVSVESGAIVAVLICVLGVVPYGALAAAVASLVGALMLNVRAIGGALLRTSRA